MIVKEYSSQFKSTRFYGRKKEKKNEEEKKEERFQDTKREGVPPQPALATKRLATKEKAEGKSENGERERERGTGKRKRSGKKCFS